MRNRRASVTGLSDRRLSRRWSMGLGVFALAATILAGCGGGGFGTYHTVQDGKLTIGSDTTYAPAEFIDNTKSGADSFVGYDMDLARELAKRLKLTFNPRTGGFDSLINDVSGPALGSQRYDISISSFTINTDRQKKVNMIPYLRAGESILVPVGNPKHITKFDDMCGMTVSVQNGTVELGELKDANGEGDKSSGQAPDCASNKVKILSFDSEDDVINQVLNGRADASYQDQPVTGYYVKQHAGKAEVGGVTVAPSPEGIVVRKDNAALETAIKNALSAMMADGTYKQI
ncbi:MAG TPA: ABC transporter substrate-binding protein, partial [Ktedonobacterales bacterium]|nr:ABC transporter substrate-binding protein [Ktedonobacterales bacterium]